MDKQLYYDKGEGMYWYMGDDGNAKFYGWYNEVTNEEAEGAIDKQAPESDEE